MSIPLCYRRAIVLTVLTLVTLSALLVVNPRVAADIVRENHAVEWLQVALFAVTAVVALAAARRPPAALDVILALLFAAFVEVELDLDQRVFGRPVIDKRFLLSRTVPLPTRLLVALVLLGLAAGVLGYVWWRRAEFLRAVRALMREPWGRLLVVGLALFVAVQVFEKALGRALPLPKYFLEESLELIVALYCLVAVVEHARHDKRSL